MAEKQKDVLREMREEAAKKRASMMGFTPFMVEEYADRLASVEPDWERLVEPWPDDAVVVTVKAIYRNENGGQVSTRCFADFRHPVPALKVGDRVKA